MDRLQKIVKNLYTADTMLIRKLPFQLRVGSHFCIYLQNYNLTIFQL